MGQKPGIALTFGERFCPPTEEELQEDKTEEDSKEDKFGAYFDRLARCECFIKEKIEAKESEDKEGQEKREAKIKYFSKYSLTSISFENVTASLNSVNPDGQTYQNRLRKLSQYDSTLRMCLSIRTKQNSKGVTETNLGDFWNIIEKPDVFNKFSALIIAEKLLKILSGKEYLHQDFLLRCAFAYQTHIPVEYNDKSALYFLKALTQHYEALVKEPAFIFVDEFQNYSVFELRCLKAAFAAPTFNLYGDFDQRIEEKGIELQDALEDLFSPQMYNLNINYRNAKQITEYIKSLSRNYR